MVMYNDTYRVISLKFKCLISALKEDRVVVFLICNGREFYNLETDEEKELEPAVVWWKSMIKFKGWYARE